MKQEHADNMASAINELPRWAESHGVKPSEVARFLHGHNLSAKGTYVAYVKVTGTLGITFTADPCEDAEEKAHATLRPEIFVDIDKAVNALNKNYSSDLYYVGIEQVSKKGD